MLEPLHKFLGIIMPACASFGPLFLVFGILGCTSKTPKTKPSVNKAFLVAGGVMITLALWSSVLHDYAPR